MTFHSAALGDLNANQINWSPGAGTPCTSCRPHVPKNEWPPNAGSYASSLGHFEATCGPFPGERNQKLRLLVLFQDPRPGEDNFTVTPPLSAGPIGPDLHRYFCLTPVAWRSLYLHEPTMIGSESPRWPQESDARHYLHRYFRVGRGGRAWAYDALIAYFIWLLRPADAYVTNLAKCYFGRGERQHSVAIPTCVKTHLAREIEVFCPTAVLSFAVSTVRVLGNLHDLGLPPGSPIKVVLPAQHPAARTGGHQGKRALFRDGLLHYEADLRALGVNAREVAASWDRHVDSLFNGP